MAILTPSNTQSPRKSINIEGGIFADATPFKTYITSIDDANESFNVKVQRYSKILTAPQARGSLDNPSLPLIGVDIDFTLNYGDKMWIEVFLDANRSPVFAIVRTGTHWESVIVDSNNTTRSSNLYPEEIELITKFDLTNKTTEIEAVLQEISDMSARAITTIDNYLDNGVISEEYHATLSTATLEAYSAVTTTVTTYRNDMASFFASAPTAVWRKQMRLFIPVAYSTRNMNASLEGEAVKFFPSPPATPAAIPTVSAPRSLKWVQCVSSDLLLVDSNLSNIYPVKIAIPWHRPVYDFQVEGGIEDVVVTGIS